MIIVNTNKTTAFGNNSMNGAIWKNFGVRLFGWEEKDKPENYPLTRLDPNKAVFESIGKDLRLTYERVSAEKMDILLEEKNKAGVWEKSEFHYVAKK